jgi:hypothetical protein
MKYPQTRPSSDRRHGKSATAVTVSAACAIAPELPGLAVAGDTSGGWSRIRTPYLSLGDAAEICRESAHLVPDLPALKPFRPDVPRTPRRDPGPGRPAAPGDRLTLSSPRSA